MPRSSRPTARSGTQRRVPELLDPSDAAELLGVSKKTVYNWIHEDRVPYIELPGGGNYRLPLRALLASLGGNYDLAAALDEQAGELEETAIVPEAAAAPSPAASGRFPARNR